ncbi:RNA methyltransferase [Desertibaculum subflavum]|uniref:RNA methyltransferase n=1 Tax=Desertibaculum subflavum TaxID=2268458 RepID=UPI000E66F48C
MTTNEVGVLVVVLVEPQMGENIGAAARAMLNFGITELRLVKPHQPWPNKRAKALGSGADQVLDGAQVFDSTAAAVADLTRLYATTARHREMLKPVATPRQAAIEARRFVAAGERVGLMFGGERVGLERDDVVLAHTIVTIPTNPRFYSLNLAQAVLLLAYEYAMAGEAEPARERFDTGRTRPANRGELIGLFEHLETELDEAGFFDNIKEKRAAILHNIRNSLQRGALLEQDVRTLRGVIKAIAGKRIPGSRRAKAAAKP